MSQQTGSSSPTSSKDDPKSNPLSTFAGVEKAEFPTEREDDKKRRASPNLGGEVSAHIAQARSTNLTMAPMTPQMDVAARPEFYNTIRNSELLTRNFPLVPSQLATHGLLPSNSLIPTAGINNQFLNFRTTRAPSLNFELAKAREEALLLKAIQQRQQENRLKELDYARRLLLSTSLRGEENPQVLLPGFQPPISSGVARLSPLSRLPTSGPSSSQKPDENSEIDSTALLAILNNAKNSKETQKKDGNR